ncbi:hypothetical protein [uncultured Ferrimonas sp.]|uniref:hypothetical protein n=1 Tax=uncultured Ferrimonas sp. TaxID=432640 RepID=UPI00260A7821|nr:hypothetical protein [uncultured Ferrimonas sp.]
MMPILQQLNALPALLRQHQLGHIGCATVGHSRNSLARCEHTAAALAQSLSAPLLVDLDCSAHTRTPPQHRSNRGEDRAPTNDWNLNDISAHTAIDHADRFDLLLAPQTVMAPSSEQLQHALLRWQQEYPVVLVHCGSLQHPDNLQLAQGCQGLLLWVDAGQDDEASVRRCLQECQLRQINVVAMVLDKQQQPPLGQWLAQACPRWVPLSWPQWLQQQPWLNGLSL